MATLILQSSGGRYIGTWQGFPGEVRQGEQIEFAGRTYKVDTVTWTTSGYLRATVHPV